MKKDSSEPFLTVAGIRLIAALVLAALTAGTTIAEEPPAVLVIYSYGASLPWEGKVIAGLKEAIDSLPPQDKPTIFEETLDSSRLGNTAGKEAWLKYLNEKYGAVGIDTVMTESQQAAELTFSLPELFPEAKRYIFHHAPLDSHPPALQRERRFSSAADLERAVATITEVLPNTKRIVAVLDKSVIGQARSRQLNALARKLPGSVSLELWDNFLEAELYERTRSLGTDTAILYLPVQRDRAGAPLVPTDVARALAQAAPVPVFSHFDTLIGTGIVGGYVVSAYQLGWLMGRTAAYGDRAAPKTQDNYTAATMGYYFDERALRRWGIQEAGLPAGSRVLFRERTFAREYATYLALIIAAFVLETALVFALISSSIRRKRAMTLLAEERATLEEKVRLRTIELETMFKEFQHRVKNGLSIITSLVSLEAGRMEDERARQSLDNLEARISALSTLYDMLYATGGTMEVAANAYLATLIENLGTGLGCDARGITLDTRLEAVPLDIKRAISLALITNELVTNAVKYAFPDGRTGAIEVRLYRDGDRLRFQVADDGVGLPYGFEPENSSGLGMTLVSLLSRQLEGELTWASQAGASFSLVFPK